MPQVSTSNSGNIKANFRGTHHISHSIRLLGEGSSPFTSLKGPTYISQEPKKTLQSKILNNKSFS